jgi:hypothetical protein
VSLADVVAAAVTVLPGYVPSAEAIEELIEDFSIPCDFYVDGKVLCQGEVAEWIMYRNPCCPTSATTPALACDCCKEVRVNDMISLECHFCGKTWEHSTDAYNLIEKIKK